MIKRGSQLPTIALNFEHPKLPGVTMAQVAADSQTVVVAYLNHLGNALDVREFAVSEHPELRDIVKFTYFDDVWDLDMLVALVDFPDPEEPCGELAPLVPAYLQSLQAAV